MLTLSLGWPAPCVLLQGAGADSAQPPAPRLPVLIDVRWLVPPPPFFRYIRIMGLAGILVVGYSKRATDKWDWDSFEGRLEGLAHLWPATGRHHCRRRPFRSL